MDEILDLIDGTLEDHTSEDMGTLEPTVTNKPEKNMGEKLGPVAKRLEHWNKSCRDVFIDLRTVKFGADDEDMYLDFEDKSIYAKRIYFKHNPDDPKDSRILHPQKQFCKILGVPHKYFMDSRPSMKKNMVKLHQAAFNADNGEDAQYMARVRESEEHAVLRALLPMNHSLIQNHELLNIVNESAQPEFIDFVNGDQRDDLIMHARCIFSEEYEVLETPVRVGFSLVASELGASPMTVEVLIYDMLSKVSYIASYGGESFFKSDYKGIQPSDIKDMFPLLLSRVRDEVTEMLNNISYSQKDIRPEDVAAMVSGWKGLPPKFKKSLFHEACECGDDMGTILDFARHMSLIAKDYDWKKRIHIEKAAGRLLNLFFAKN